jgi:hypothetical protein
VAAGSAASRPARSATLRSTSAGSRWSPALTAGARHSSRVGGAATGGPSGAVAVTSTVASQRPRAGSATSQAASTRAGAAALVSSGSGERVAITAIPTAIGQRTMPAQSRSGRNGGIAVGRPALTSPMSARSASSSRFTVQVSGSRARETSRIVSRSPRGEIVRARSTNTVGSGPGSPRWRTTPTNRAVGVSSDWPLTFAGSRPSTPTTSRDSTRRSAR